MTEGIDLEDMSRKQQIYYDMIDSSLSWIRNVSTWSWWRRLRDRSTMYESELVHNLHRSFLNSGFTDHDLWFLNHQAKWYCEQCNPRLSPLYRDQSTAIAELISLLPQTMINRLEWQGPAMIAEQTS